MKKYYIYKITTERLSSEVCILVNASDPKEVAAINKEIDFVSKRNARIKAYISEFKLHSVTDPIV